MKPYRPSGFWRRQLWSGAIQPRNEEERTWLQRHPAPPEGSERQSRSPSSSQQPRDRPAARSPPRIARRSRSRTRQTSPHRDQRGRSPRGTQRGQFPRDNRRDYAPTGRQRSDSSPLYRVRASSLGDEYVVLSRVERQQSPSPSYARHQRVENRRRRSRSRSYDRRRQKSRSRSHDRREFRYDRYVGSGNRRDDRENSRTQTDQDRRASPRTSSRSDPRDQQPLKRKADAPEVQRERAKRLATEHDGLDSGHTDFSGFN